MIFENVVSDISKKKNLLIGTICDKKLGLRVKTVLT
jgi:hypothetical protein